DVLGNVGLGTALWVAGPNLGEVEAGGNGPGEGAFGVVAVDGDLAVAGLAEGAGVLAGDTDGRFALLGEAGVVEDEDAVALGGEGEHALDTLAVEVVVVPGGGGEQALELLLGGAGDVLGNGVAVFVGQFGEQAGEVAFEGVGPFAATEVEAERLQERGQLGQRLRGGLRHPGCGFHIPLYGKTPN